jgi:glucose-1-phosphate thymidylyltransferase
MKGIVLAGGTGSRLWPLTISVSKQLLPVYDKPLIHYPISILMLAGIREILIITTPRDRQTFQQLLGDGSSYGVSFSYEVQDKPEGLAQALVIGESFIGSAKIALILGDNIFYGASLGTQLRTLRQVEGAHVFAYKVRDPERYGVIEFDSTGKVTSLVEKPTKAKSPYAIEIAKSIKPSVRGEIEITDVNLAYLKQGKLSVSILDRGTAWLDTGTFDSLSAASSFVRIIEERQGQKISCLEEVAWRNNWITDNQLISLAENYKSSPFADYLKNLIY